MIGQSAPAPAPTPAVVHDCWNRIGVHGDGSCPELKEHVHCRNCPVHATAALALLERPVAPDYRTDRTSHFAQKLDIQDRETRSVLIFRVATEWFAVPTQVVREVAGGRSIHSLPHRRAGAVIGVANVRGELLVCVSLARLLGFDGPARPDRPAVGPTDRFLVLGRDDLRVVCPVEQVHGIHHVAVQDLKPAPSTVTQSKSTFSKAVAPWEGRLVGLLDDQTLFHAFRRSLG